MKINYLCLYIISNIHIKYINIEIKNNNNRKSGAIAPLIDCIFHFKLLKVERR